MNYRQGFSSGYNLPEIVLDDLPGSQEFDSEPLLCHPGWRRKRFDCNMSFPILAVGAEALPVTPSGGALFAS